MNQFIKVRRIAAHGTAPCVIAVDDIKRIDVAGYIQGYEGAARITMSDSTVEVAETVDQLCTLLIELELAQS